MPLVTEALPAKLRRFLVGHFDTVTALEVLLLLHRERPRAWSSGAVARRLRLDPDQSEGILAGLDRRGLVVRQGSTFEYRPRTEEAAGAVETLADVYSRYRYRIMHIIFTPRRRGTGDSHRTAK